MEKKIEKAAVFIDGGHYHYRLFKEGWRINYKKFIKYLESKGYTINEIFYFEGMPTWLSYSNVYPNVTYEKFELAKKAKMKYFDLLRSFGFKVHHKPVHRIYDIGIEDYKFKCNFDVEITIKVMEIIFTKEIDTIILCSGDGDFLELVKYLKSKKRKNVVVVGINSARTNDHLKKVADELMFLYEIREEIELIIKKAHQR